MEGKKKFKILFVSAEVSPFAKTGGLADVAGSLPKSLAGMGNDVRIVMPRYKSVKSEMTYLADFPVQIGGKRETCIVRETELRYKKGRASKGLPVYFIDSYSYFDRDGVYCHFDDGERFAFFCRAVLEMLPRISFQPDIIHCNDWHTGPICMLLRESYSRDSFYNDISTVYTIHNLEYQGNFPKDVLWLFNLGDEVFNPEKAEFYGMFSFMKTGIAYCDIINTVSETYAREIQTPQFGERLDGLLKSRSGELYGIVNGISYEDFDPSTDKRIFKNYGPDNPEAKSENKKALQEEMGLPVSDVPLLGLVSRLSGQKGLDLVMEIMDELFSREVQFVLLGTGDEYYEDAFKGFMRKYPDKFAAFIGFNAALAQRIYAGCDMFLMPSRFEPCGLGQIISFRYGTIPVVRATGGLAETVIDVDSDPEAGNGFSFNDFSSRSLLETVDRAVRLYTEAPEAWRKLVEKAMTFDFSWSSSAGRYMEIYRRAVAKVRG